MNTIKPKGVRAKYRFTDGNFHEVNVCNKCGEPYPTYQCSHACSGCGVRVDASNTTRLTVKWIDERRIVEKVLGVSKNNTNGYYIEAGK